jgi:hypothetical protein
MFIGKIRKINGVTYILVPKLVSDDMQLEDEKTVQVQIVERSEE